MEETVFTDKEALLLAAIESSSVTVTQPLPRYLDLEETWDQLETILMIHQKAESIAIRLRPVIGRFLLWAKHNPEFFRRKGFRSYDKFIREYVCGLMKLSRTSLFQARFTSERLPTLTPRQFEELGPTKAAILASYSQSSDPSFPQYLEAAQTHTADGLQKWAEERGLIEEGSSEAEAIIIHSNGTVARMWEEFRTHPDVWGHVGNDQPFRILEGMLQECYFWLGDPERQEPCEHCGGTGRRPPAAGFQDR